MPEPAMTPEALERFLASAEPDRRPSVTAFRPITGGYSRLSAVADVRWDDGAGERFVLRGDPPPGDGVFVSDRDAEWALLQALAGSGAVPVARPRWYDATGEHLGTKCIVFDHVQGRNLQDVLATAPDPRHRPGCSSTRSRRSTGCRSTCFPPRWSTRPAGTTTSTASSTCTSRSTGRSPAAPR